MVYKLLRQVAKLSFLVFFRHIHVSNIKKVSHDKPTILCCNHPNGFLEPCLIACFLPMPLHFLARGDLFSVNWLKWILKATNQIPIYRFRDGFSGLRGNDETFQYCYQILNEGKHILIFPEGSTQQVRYLRPLQKGPARLAFGALSEFPDLDIQILPVNIHFTAPANFRSQVMIDYGEPIILKNYTTLHHQNPKKAVTDLTGEIFEQMKSLGVEAIEQEDWTVKENIWKLIDTEHGIKWVWPISKTNSSLLPRYVSKVRKFEKLTSSSRIKINTQLDVYFDQIAKLSLSDGIVKNGLSGFILRFCIIIIAFIPALIGFVFTIIPAVFVKKIADAKVKDIEFYSSILSTVGMFVFIVYFILLFFAFLFFFGWKALLIFILPFLGYLTVIYIEIFSKLRKQLRWLSLSYKEKQNLINARKNLSEIIRQL